MLTVLAQTCEADPADMFMAMQSCKPCYRVPKQVEGTQCSTTRAIDTTCMHFSCAPCSGIVPPNCQPTIARNMEDAGIHTESSPKIHMKLTTMPARVPMKAPSGTRLPHLPNREIHWQCLRRLQAHWTGRPRLLDKLAS